MLRFSILGIPVGVDWFFWLIMALLGGGLNAQGMEDLPPILIFVAVAFVSILAHELGHALVGRKYGANPAIRLHGLGGLTFLRGANFSKWQSIAVSAAGPAMGLMLGIVFVAIGLVVRSSNPFLEWAVTFGLYINFIWTAANLLPIQPLDGGQILRELLGPSRARLASNIGFVLAAALCIWALMERQVFIALMLGLFAFYNFKQTPGQGGVIKN